VPVRPETRDPRSIVTPDAFEVSDELLGLPLASPSRRFFALLIDLMVIGLITAVTKSFALVLGVVAAVVFIRAGFKRTPVKGSVFGRAMRFSVGCFGVIVAAVTALLWSIFGIDFGRNDAGDDFVSVAGRTEGGMVLEDAGIGSLLGLAGGGLALERAQDADAARTAMRALVEAGRNVGLTRAQIRTALNESVPTDRAWSAAAPDMIETVLDELTLDESSEASPTEATLGDLSAMPLEEALEEYGSTLASEAESDEARRAALRLRLMGEIAGDTLRSLAGRLADSRDETERMREQLASTREQLDEATSGGIFGSVRHFVDELGFGFGWASLYLTIFLSWWRGQTLGKRMMRIRVVRLDGEPINWWIAFERAGGYAAGFATGLLGFAQVYWDSNRQAIHDRIVGTVVVLEGAEKVEDWKEAL
jgi:uncharacterized RDD family membrane protein YckC